MFFYPQIETLRLLVWPHKIAKKSLCRTVPLFPSGDRNSTKTKFVSFPLKCQTALIITTSTIFFFWGNWNFFFFFLLFPLWIRFSTVASFCFTILELPVNQNETPAVSTKNKRFSQSNHTERFKFLSLSLRLIIAEFLSQRSKCSLCATIVMKTKWQRKKTMKKPEFFSWGNDCQFF